MDTFVCLFRRCTAILILDINVLSCLIEVSRGSRSIDGGDRGIGEGQNGDTVFDKCSESFPIFSLGDILSSCTMYLTVRIVGTR
jgi:hypothetical protein